MGQWIRTGLLFCGYYQVTKAACCSLDVIRLLKQPAKQPPAAGGGVLISGWGGIFRKFATQGCTKPKVKR